MSQMPGPPPGAAGPPPGGGFGPPGPPPGGGFRPPGPPPGGYPIRPRPPRRGAGAWLWIGLSLVGLIAALIGGAVVGVIVGAQDRQDMPLAAGYREPIQVSAQQIAEIAATRTRALQAKDLKGFLSPLDQGNAELLAEQTRLFHNLQKITFAESRYVPAGQDGRSVDSFGRGVTFDLDVSFVHRIDGYDPKPVAEGYRWTIVKKDAKSQPTITAVTGAPASSSSNSKFEYYPAPWDKYADMRIVRTEHTLFLVDRPMVAKAEKYAPVAERAVADILAAWRAGGQPGEIFTGFVTSLAPDKKEFANLFQTAKEPPVEAGHSMPMYAATDSNADVMGSTRVVMDTSSGFFTSGNEDDVLEIFRHEYAHSMVSGIDAGKNILGLELWIAEGFAEYVANRGTGRDRRLAGARPLLRTGAFDGSLPSLVTWNTGGAAMVSLRYHLSHQAMRFIAKRYGEPKVFEFVATYYTGTSVEDAFPKVLGVSREAFERDWATFVRAQAR